MVKLEQRRDLGRNQGLWELLWKKWEFQSDQDLCLQKFTKAQISANI